MSLRSLLYLFAVAIRQKMLEKPTRHQTPGKHHRVHAGSKLWRRVLRGNLVRGH